MYVNLRNIKLIILAVILKSYGEHDSVTILIRLLIGSLSNKTEVSILNIRVTQTVTERIHHRLLLGIKPSVTNQHILAVESCTATCSALEHLLGLAVLLNQRYKYILVDGGIGLRETACSVCGVVLQFDGI